ncbi:MAG: helix-turn-helix transcriptional regulator [Devosiaceae bacterium]|nr:helix-turn-helix transcriptional regulator [Devosiaceae bacterium MH13]
MDALTASDATDAFAALSQPLRLQAYRLLVQAGAEGVAAGAIAARLDVRQNTMSANMAVLLHAKLVRRERRGRSIVYFADFATMQSLLGFMLEDCCGGRPDLCQPLIQEIACAC